MRNFVCVIHKMRPDEALVETEVPASWVTAIGVSNVLVACLLWCSRFCHQLFPRGALEMYTAKNMGWDVTPEQV